MKQMKLTSSWENAFACLPPMTQRGSGTEILPSKCSVSLPRILCKKVGQYKHIDRDSSSGG